VIVALVIFSAFLHAAWNAMLRVEPDKDRALVAAIAAAALVAAAVAIVRALATGEPPFANATGVAWSLVAGVFELLYFASLARALDRGPLGPIYTVSRGGAIVIVWPLSVALYGEPLALKSIAGSAIVLAGLALAGTGAGDTRAARRDALAWAVACACSIAGYHLAYKAALRAGGNPSAVFAVSLLLATTINVARVGGEGRRAAAAIVRARTARVLAMGVVCGGSFLVLMEALSGGDAAFVLTLRNTSVLFATGLAFAIGERPRHAQIAGATLVAAGAAVMAWP
jgi:drug/metabolite transporter (DMT)-like permease